MPTPRVSVIIPAYNGSGWLGDAIDSVLRQSYEPLELIVVDDASTDGTADLVKAVGDRRVKYIAHGSNRGVDLARATGVGASVGEVIAFLDQDDMFHERKLEAHVSFLDAHADVDLSYNHRFELHYSSRDVRDLWRPPSPVSLSDLVLGFPLAPSDWVMRRHWALVLVDLIAEFRQWIGMEIFYLGRMFLAGCRFGCVPRALNYRRHHSGRPCRDLAGGCAAEIAAQDAILHDPRCPDEVRALHDAAHANIYAFWAFRAFVDGNHDLGREFVRKAVGHKPSLVAGTPCELVASLAMNASDDDTVDHAELLRNVLSNLPPEHAGLLAQLDLAIFEGHVIRGTRRDIWGAPEAACEHFERAAALGVEVDDRVIERVTKNLLDYAAEYGDALAGTRLKRLTGHLHGLSRNGVGRRLAATYAIGRAFECYQQGQSGQVPRHVLAAVLANPGYLVNRGVLAIALRSLVARPSR